MIDLYTAPTPNGYKVSILLEELQLPSQAISVNLEKGEQKQPDYLKMNPNGRIPVIVDRERDNWVVFESGAILLYLAEKFNAFLPADSGKRAECLSWVFWQMGSAPYLGGGFGHFYAYSPERWEYPINRFSMEVKRQLDVLNRHLADNQYMCGGEYTIADMAIWPWYGALVLNRVYNAAEFLEADSYDHVMKWAKEIDHRETVTRGRMVNRMTGELNEQLRERHSASDFDDRTQDKIESAQEKG